MMRQPRCCPGARCADRGVDTPERRREGTPRTSRSALPPECAEMSALTSSIVCRSLWYASAGGSFSSVISRSTCAGAPWGAYLCGLDTVPGFHCNICQHATSSMGSKQCLLKPPR